MCWDHIENAMPDRRNPSEIVQVAQHVEQKIDVKTEMLAGFGRWVIGLLAASCLTFVGLFWNQSTAIKIQTHQLEALTGAVKDLQAEFKASDQKYFSRAEGVDHEQRLRALEAKARR